MVYTKEEFLKLLKDLDILCIEFDLKYQAPPEQYKTVDVRTGVCASLQSFKSMEITEHDKIIGEISITLKKL